MAASFTLMFMILLFNRGRAVNESSLLWSSIALPVANNGRRFAFARSEGRGEPDRRGGAMPPERGRVRKRDRRIDAAIDHFVAMGYTERQVRAAVTALLKVRLLLCGSTRWRGVSSS